MKYSRGTRQLYEAINLCREIHFVSLCENADLKFEHLRGFVEEGRRRETVWQNGAFRDDVFSESSSSKGTSSSKETSRWKLTSLQLTVGILASEWRERRKQEEASESK